MAKQWKPGKRQLALMDEIKRGNKLCVEITEHGRSYFWAQGINDERPSPDVVRSLQKRGLLVPVPDGLFGDSQSFTLAEPAA